MLCAQETQVPPPSPQKIVQEAVANEVAANSSTAKHMFHSRRQTAKGSQTHLYVETNDAMAGMLIAINNRPVTPQQEQAEKDRLAWLMNNPDQLRKKHAREKEDTDRSLRILRALPDAFRYEYAGTQNSEAGLGREGDQLVRLDFSPNPAYSPPSRVEQVLEGMQGYLLIDTTANRLARIDGTLAHDVSFGWGLIGRLDKGGHFLVDQADVGDNCWELTRMNLNITGKILVFKSISMISDETFSDFQRVPDNLPFAKGVELLTAERDKMAHAEPSSPNTDKKNP